MQENYHFNRVTVLFDTVTAVSGMQPTHSTILPPHHFLNILTFLAGIHKYDKQGREAVNNLTKGPTKAVRFFVFLRLCAQT